MDQITVCFWYLKIRMRMSTFRKIGSECQDSLKMMIAERIGKEVELQVKQNDTGHASEEIYPDLRQLINFEIEEDDF